jgi:trimethylamine--corrinoid protein Co-methyltransferase
MGPGGNFITAKHTRRFMRKEHYQPSLSNRESREEWEAEGKKDTWENAAEMVRTILDSPANRLPDTVRQLVSSEFKDIVA